MSVHSGSESLTPGTPFVEATNVNGGQSTVRDVGMTVDWVTTVDGWGEERCHSSHSGIVLE